MRDEVESIWYAMKDSHYKRTIQQLKRKLSAETDLDEAISIALHQIILSVHAETGSVWFYDRFGDGMIHPRAVYDETDLSDVQLHIGEGIAGAVVQDGKSIIISNCEEEKNWARHIDRRTGFETKTMMCVPLQVDQITFGCVQIINKKDGLEYDEEDLHFAESLVKEIANLMWDLGLLKEYMLWDLKKSEERKITFDEIYLASSEQEMVMMLKKMEHYNQLPFQEQQEIINLSSRIRRLFQKTKR